MTRFAVLLLLSVSPVMAMTPEDCRSRLSAVAGKIPGVEELRLAPEVTEDGWCRVIDGPLGAGLEWRLDIDGRDFGLEVRQERFVFEEFGPFALIGRFTATDNAMSLGPLRLTAANGDAIGLSAALGMAGSLAPDFFLSEGRLSVAGGNGLVNEVLAWAFRQDLRAARSSFIAARDQRAQMRDWLDAEARPLVDGASAEAFLKMVEAYPRAAGTALLSVREDSPLGVGGLINAVLFGAPFNRSEAAQLIRAAGLTLTWQPD